MVESQFQVARRTVDVSLVVSLVSLLVRHDLIRHLTSEVRLNAEAESIVDSVSFSLEKSQILILTRGEEF
jgi:hypothetical protein